MLLMFVFAAAAVATAVAAAAAAVAVNGWFAQTQTCADIMFTYKFVTAPVDLYCECLSGFYRNISPLEISYDA